MLIENVKVSAFLYFQTTSIAEIHTSVTTYQKEEKHSLKCNLIYRKKFTAKEISVTIDPIRFLLLYDE